MGIPVKERKVGRKRVDTYMDMACVKRPIESDRIGLDSFVEGDEK